eukprot:CAMPEP_0204310904 /NCGR_PEP_ID=MMETSP0469-20131031/2011_1 /ASSEMBLY_ACC=CAM_ASM_000384 /TAXON_ID=2969 /ORGANISM="Oxyrrhis marina" /LENGTH=344 /DNA_ID=CAMNT_0051290759 /DNA_START=1 /DNA_END=1032 /DNA_ORIENTATION=+
MDSIFSCFSVSIAPPSIAAPEQPVPQPSLRRPAAGSTATLGGSDWGASSRASICTVAGTKPGVASDSEGVLLFASSCCAVSVSPHCVDDQIKAMPKSILRDPPAPGSSTTAAGSESGASSSPSEFVSNRSCVDVEALEVLEDNEVSVFPEVTDHACLFFVPGPGYFGRLRRGQEYRFSACGGFQENFQIQEKREDAWETVILHPGTFPEGCRFVDRPEYRRLELERIEKRLSEANAAMSRPTDRTLDLAVGHLRRHSKELEKDRIKLLQEMVDERPRPPAAAGKTLEPICVGAADATRLLFRKPKKWQKWTYWTRPAGKHEGRPAVPGSACFAEADPALPVSAL